MKNKIYQPIYLLLIIFFSYIHIAYAVNVTAKLGRTQITQGESFNLTYTIKGQYSDAPPNFRALEKNFIILGTSNNVQMTIVNSRSSSITQWSLTLLPKHKGSITIPSIRFATGYSKPIRITIFPAQQIIRKKGYKRAFLKVDLSNKTPYIQSQVTYRIRLYYATSISNGNLTQPEVTDAILFHLGNDKQYQTVYGQQKYHVLERNYAIFPQKSGTFTILPPVFTGLEHKKPPAGINNLAALLNANGKPLRLIAPSIKMRVKPIPNTAHSKNWLPAQSLSLKEDWSNMSGLKVGDPITRTIIITAEGLTGAQLPDIDKEMPPGANTYSDKSITKNNLNSNIIVGQRKEKIAYIPTKTGTLMIPEIQIPWWDTKNNVLKTAILPSRTLKIASADTQQTPQLIMPTTKPTQSIKKPPASHNAMISHISNQVNFLYWPWIAIGLFILWLNTLSLWWWQNRRKRTNALTHKEKTDSIEERALLSLRRVRLDVKNACLNNNGKKAKDALLKWATLQWPGETFRNLSAIIAKVEPHQLAYEIKQLDKLLYAEQISVWHGQGLWVTFNKYKPAKPTSRSNYANPLPPLYPEQS